MKVVCSRCKREFDSRSNSKYNEDGLCGKCRKALNWISNCSELRKTKTCECGKKILGSSKLCSSCSQKGKRNHSWKEVKQDRSVVYTVDWKNWRKQVLERDKNKCRLCGNSSKGLHIHHIIPRRKDLSKIFDKDNGITLCKSCHSKLAFKEDLYAPMLHSIVLHTVY